MNTYAATAPSFWGFTRCRDNAGIVMRDEQWNKTIPRESVKPRLLQAIKRIQELISLPNNWDSYGSPRIQINSVKGALDLLIAVHSSFDIDKFPAPAIFPAPGGGIQFEWTVANRELEVEILPDGSVEILKVVNGQPVEEAGFPQLSKKLEPFFTWLISEYTWLISE